MKKSEKESIRQLILNEIAEIEQQLVLSAESSKPVELDQALAGRVSRIDAIQQQKIAEASLQRAERKLQSLRRALVHTETEDFGICTDCGNPIPVARIKIKPESTTCVACKQLKEG